MDGADAASPHGDHGDMREAMHEDESDNHVPTQQEEQALKQEGNGMDVDVVDVGIHRYPKLFGTDKQSPFLTMKDSCEDIEIADQHGMHLVYDPEYDVDMRDLAKVYAVEKREEARAQRPAKLEHEVPAATSDSQPYSVRISGYNQEKGQCNGVKPALYSGAEGALPPVDKAS